MTNKEIKLKLSEIALSNGLSIESVKMFYEWIKEEPEKAINVNGEQTDYDDVPSSEIVNYVRRIYSRSGGYAVGLEKVLKANNLDTIGDVIRLGYNGFKRLHSVDGRMLATVVDALNVLCGINYW